ncbi:MAG TPA: hypothetical protein VGF97_10625 [Rhizomicrobium sp.]|jgi:hypothetical protein
MRLVFLPTLFDLQNMLGNQTYVDFVWMWREREREKHSRERLDKWLAKMPQREIESLPKRVMPKMTPPMMNSPQPVAVAEAIMSQDEPETSLVALVAEQSASSSVSALPVKPSVVRSADATDGADGDGTGQDTGTFPAVLEYPRRTRSRRVASPAPL